jgi:arylsulfatase A-like enzyme
MKLLKIAALIWGLGINLVSAQTIPTAPNFLFIFVDDQAWDATSVEMLPGEELSRAPGFNMPNLDQIAEQGMIFSQAYATHPKCENSRSSLQMGRTSTTLNSVDKDGHDWNAPSAEAFVNVLKEANPSYRAAHYGKWQWPAPHDPVSLGYDDSDGITLNEVGTSEDPDDPKLTFSITRRAEDFMEDQVREGHPFYLQLSYYATHSPLQALDSTLAKYSGDRALEAAMTEDLDTNIGYLLEKLDELGITEETYVIYMSDNGMTSGVLKGGKRLLDEGGIRVPFVISGPGIEAGVYSDVPVVAYDLYPTIIDFVAPGFSVPDGVEGGSWKPVLLNGGSGEVERPIDRLVWHHDVEIPYPQTAMRKGDYKLIYYWNTKEAFLYNVSTDIRESNNLVDEHPQMTQEMLLELKAHVKAGIDPARYARLESGLPGAEDTRPNRPPAAAGTGGG